MINDMTNTQRHKLRQFISNKLYVQISLQTAFLENLQWVKTHFNLFKKLDKNTSCHFDNWIDIMSSVKRIKITDCFP